MRTIAEKIQNEYVKARTEQFAGHPIGIYFRNEIPKIIYDTGIISQDKYLVTGSVGQGVWVESAWFAVFDRSITTSARKGVYIVYLLSKDGNTLYLTFNQGCEDIRSSHTKRETIAIMRERANEIAQKIDSRGFNSDQNATLGENLTERAELYQKGIIFYKEYKKGQLPSEEVFEKDLASMMLIYKDYKANCLQEEMWWPSREEYDPGFSKEKWIELLNDSNIFTGSALEMMAEFYAYGGTATCAQLAEHYQRTYNYYLMTSVHLAERIVKATGCPVVEEEKNAQNAKWWPVLYVGKDASKEEKGTFIWKIREELYEALTEYGIEKYLAERENSKIGTFDSWEIIDEHTAIKTCDKSFFEHNGSGVPKGICWFFDAEDMQPGETKNLTLVYGAKQYSLKVANDSTDRRRVRIFWNAELGRIFNESRNGLAKVAFVKMKPQTYEITLYGGEKEMTIKEKVEAIKAYIAEKGFNYEGDLIENFYLSLKSKPFVILAGTSGTGKTRLVKLFAEAIGAEMKLVPVRPDWSDSSDLFGHTDLSNHFHPGAIIDFIKKAEWNKEKPFFLCLDEMNLARVEYYLSDFLSIIETRDRKENGEIETDPLVDVDYYKDEAAQGKYGRVFMPENLYIIGTVNMDETTFPFSKKVLDRANTIEFSFVNLMAKPKKSIVGSKKLNENNAFLKTDYLYLQDCDDDSVVDTVCFDLEALNQILVKANLHVGYRVRDEILFYMMNNKKAALLSEDAAFDHEIMQKILPRVQGSSAAIKDVLSELFAKCAGDYSGFSGVSAFEQMNSYIEQKDCKYPNSAKKIAFMMRRYEEDGFTSYWL